MMWRAKRWSSAGNDYLHAMAGEWIQLPFLEGDFLLLDVALPPVQIRAVHTGKRLLWKGVSSSWMDRQIFQWEEMYVFVYRVCFKWCHVDHIWVLKSYSAFQAYVLFMTLSDSFYNIVRGMTFYEIWLIGGLHYMHFLNIGVI